MDIAVISLVLTSATALAAVIGPIISSVITVRSNERTKKFEMYSPQVYAAVQRFTGAYAQFPRKADYSNVSDYGKAQISKDAAAAYRSFSASAYEVMSLLPNCEIHGQIISLLADLDGKKWAEAEQDKLFQALAESLARELSSGVSNKKQRKDRKAKRGKGK